ncbi:hypothetical protein ACFFRR_006216 [Megaselia abdita]
MKFYVFALFLALAVSVQAQSEEAKSVATLVHKILEQCFSEDPSVTEYPAATISELKDSIELLNDKLKIILEINDLGDYRSAALSSVYTFLHELFCENAKILIIKGIFEDFVQQIQKTTNTCKRATVILSNTAINDAVKADAEVITSGLPTPQNQEEHKAYMDKMTLQVANAYQYLKEGLHLCETTNPEFTAPLCSACLNGQHMAQMVIDSFNNNDNRIHACIFPQLVKCVAGLEFDK